jgi:hypothetical protein
MPCYFFENMRTAPNRSSPPTINVVVEIPPRFNELVGVPTAYPGF